MDAPTPQTEAADVRMLGHYQTTEKIGQGGMAVVYKGVQPSLNRTVAIKVLPERFARTPEMLGRFDREANIASQLNHPNIVQVIDRGKDGDALYIVMEYVEGESLDRIIRRGPLPIAQVMEIAIQVCDALDYAHGKGVVHRDLKPANILVEAQSGRAKIADFGIAQFETTSSGLSTLTSENVALGTMNYMSPEQRVDSHRVTHLTDIFSFGVVLYEMLAGKLPLGHFKLPSIVRPDVPMGFDTIVKRCLAEAPADRYQSAGEVKDELTRITGRYMRHHKAAAASISGNRLLDMCWVGKRRYATLAGVGAAAALGLVAAMMLREAPQGTIPAGRTPSRTVPDNDSTASTEGPAATTASNPNNAATAQADFDRALGLIRGGRPGEAVSILRRVVQMHGASPIAPEAQFAMAGAYSDLGDSQNAQREYDTLVKLYPRSTRVPEAIFLQCRLRWKGLPTRGTFSKSYYSNQQTALINDLRKLISGYPKSDRVNDALALIGEIAAQPELEDFRAAADALTQVCERAPQADALWSLAELYERKLREKASAISAYQRFVRDFPADARARDAQTRIQSLQR